MNDFSQSQSTLILIPSIKYNDVIKYVLKQLPVERICYVTLNKSYSSLRQLFEKEHIELKNIVFIDAITCSIYEPEQTDDCYFIGSPQALTELSIVITEFLKHDLNYIIFDSLTTLLVYQKTEDPVIRFVSNIVNKIKTSGCKGIFYALNIEKHNMLILESSMIMDKIIDLGEEELIKS